MKKIHYTFFTLFILLGTTCWIQFSKFESEIKSKINASIVDSIQKDLYIRVNSPKVNKRKVVSNNQPYSQDGIHVKTEKTDSIIYYDENLSKEEVYFNQSLMDQSATRILNPINLEKLHTIFQESIIKKNILTNSYILYKDKIDHKSDIYPSTNNNSFITYNSDNIELGLKKEMTVIASVSFSVTNLFRHQTDIFIISFFILILTILSYPTAYLIYKIRSKNIINHHFTGNEGLSRTITLAECGNYLFGKFTLDTKTKVLKWDNDFIDLSKRREFLLLFSLLESPDNSLTKERAAEILEIHNYKYNNQLNTSISRLRAILKPDPSVVVESKKGNGYRLVIS